MLPSIGPVRTIGPNTGAGVSSRQSSRPPTDARSTRRGHRPPVAPGCCAATLAQPTRKSLDGIKSLETGGGVRPEHLFDGPAAASELSGPASISHSASAASLSSESDLALLLGGDAAQHDADGTLVFGSFPPVVVPVPSPAAAEEAACGAEEDAAHAAAEPPAAAAASAKPSKLRATSHEYYPPAYLAAAAATALATRTISSIARSASPAPPPAAAATTEGPAAGSEERREEAPCYAAAEGAAPASESFAGSGDGADAAQPAEVATPHWVTQQQQQQHMSEQEWHHWQQQQQHWQHWHGPQQHLQQQAPPHGVPMPVYVPVLLQPYPYAPYHAQQHPHMAMMPVMLPAEYAAQEQLQQQQQLACPPSPGGLSLPADTCSVVSSAAPTPTTAAWQHSSLYSSSGSRPGSSAGSVASFAGGRLRQQQGAARDAGTVTVSALSCVKDAAGALAKVVTRHGSSLLLSLVKPGDQAPQATHAAAKSLAVARFYINAHMAAAGAAGIDAAAALTGLEGPTTPAAAAAAAAAAAGDAPELVFMPFFHGGGRAQQRGRQGADAGEGPLSFLVAKASARDLPGNLPPPVGIPACMQGRQQQQQGGSQAAGAGSSGNGASSSASAPLLKAGANTDVNKLSNAVIHNILGSGHVAMQLAGAAACHVAMRSLIRARDRLLRKFNTDIVATASFANEDTSSSIGRSTVFLRLDVMRSSLLQQLQQQPLALTGA